MNFVEFWYWFDFIFKIKGILFFNLFICEIILIILLVDLRFNKVFNVVLSVFWFNVLNFLLINIDFSEIFFDCCCIILFNFKVNVSDDWKVFLFDNELICLDLFECKLNILIFRLLRLWEIVFCLISWYWLFDIVVNFRFVWVIIWFK